LVQFGISYTQDKELKAFADSRIQDDPKLDPPIPFDEGVISFAGSGPNSRTSHLFIAYGPVKSLGRELWETPIGTVIEGMETVRRLNADYGDMPPWGHGPEQHKIRQGGKAYIEQEFPKLDYFINCRVERGDETGDADDAKDDAYEQNLLGVKKDVSDSSSSSTTTAAASSSIRTKDDNQQPAAENHTGHMNQTVLLPIFAAITVFFVLTILTRGKKKLRTKNF
jgi:cyclophilin family peptidyl-prolyl cis-trans isomerase